MPFVRLTIHDADHEPLEVHESEIPVLESQGLIAAVLPDPPPVPAPGAQGSGPPKTKEGA